MNIFRKAFEDIVNPKEKNGDNVNREKQKKTMQKRPDRDFFTKLLGYEGLMTSNPTIEIIDEVLKMYRECVEYFDTQQEPIKFYFVDKLQNALADTKNFLLISKKPEEKKLDEFSKNRRRQQRYYDRAMKFCISMFEIKNNFSFEDANIEKVEKQRSNKKNLHLNLNKITNENQEYDDDKEEGDESGKNEIEKEESSEFEDDKQSNKAEWSRSPLKIRVPSSSANMPKAPLSRQARAKKLTLQIQVQEQHQEQCEEMEDMVQNYEEEVKEADKLVRDNLNQQVESVKNRLSKRSLFVAQKRLNSKKHQDSSSTQFSLSARPFLEEPAQGEEDSPEKQIHISSQISLNNEDNENDQNDI